MSRSAILWDVDTQVDFIDPDGKLAVPGAAAVVPAMARLVGWARASGIAHVASADDHELTDPEISDEPDFTSTFPPHCLRGTPRRPARSPRPSRSTRSRSRTSPIRPRSSRSSSPAGASSSC